MSYRFPAGSRYYIPIQIKEGLKEANTQFGEGQEIHKRQWNMPGIAKFPYYPQVFGEKENSISAKLQMEKPKRHVDLQSEVFPWKVTDSLPPCRIAKERQQREGEKIMSDSFPSLLPFHPLSKISNDGPQREWTLLVQSVQVSLHGRRTGWKSIKNSSYRWGKKQTLMNDRVFNIVSTQGNENLKQNTF